VPGTDRTARADRVIGVALALLAALVLWSARSFPVVPGQKVGAGFLPTLVGIGLLVCGIALARRGLRARAAAALPNPPGAPGRLLPPLVVVGSVGMYLLAAERIGFLLVAPVVLLATFRALAVPCRAALPWALAGTLVVHLAFYKLLRVPLPWGLLRPLY